MKIILDGKTTLTKLPKILKEIITEVQAKAGVESAPVKLDKAELVFTFMVNGEPQYVTVNHDGVPELFTVAVRLDEKGNIERAVNNENETFLDEYTRAMAKGETKEYEVIQSSYKDEELETVRVNDGGDIQEIIYRHIETGNTVVRYIKNGDLVGELAFETAPENVIK
jgi:hypothetical protein